MSAVNTANPTAARGRALAITALVLAVASLLLCWVPIVNNVVFFLGVLALVVAVVAHVRARRGKAEGRGMSAASIAISVVSLVGVLVTQVFYGAVLDDIGDSVSAAADGNVAKTAADSSAESHAHRLGVPVKVGDYTVSVDHVKLDADAAVEHANQFNGPPKGRYVLARLTVTYNGGKEGDPSMDLLTRLSGSDSRIYSETTCDAVEPHPLTEAPTLTKGGTATGNVCFDVPRAALKKGPRISVEESFSIADTRAYWAVR